MNLDHLSEVLLLMFRNHSAAERFYDLLENRILWPEFVQVTHDSALQERFTLLPEFWEFFLYLHREQYKIEKDMVPFGGLDVPAYKAFQEYISKNPILDVFVDV